MDELISKQLAIETAENVAYAVDEHGSAEGWLAMLINSLKILPSAQPDLPIKEKCAYCPHCENCDVNDDLSITQSETSQMIVKVTLDSEVVEKVVRKTKDEPVMVLPPAQPEQKIGHWIPIHPLQNDDEGAYLCSNCKTGDWDIKSTDKFCKFCGTKMQGVKKNNV